jgi:hypothetical protein
MSVQSLSNSERNISFFITRFSVGDVIQTAKIQEVDMCGWTLFECYLAPAQTIVYIGWDEETHKPEWIDMEEEVTQDFIPALTQAIQQFKRGSAKAA